MVKDNQFMFQPSTQWIVATVYEMQCVVRKWVFEESVLSLDFSEFLAMKGWARCQKDWTFILIDIRVGNGRWRRQCSHWNNIIFLRPAKLWVTFYVSDAKHFTIPCYDSTRIIEIAATKIIPSIACHDVDRICQRRVHCEPHPVTLKHDM